MFRRCITFVVMMGLCASQLAVIPHAHAGMSANEKRAHDAIPHFHFHSHSGLSHEDHAHHHGHGGDHEGEPDRPASAKGSPSQPLPEGLAGTGHDTTAVYYAGGMAVTSTGVPSVATFTLFAGPAVWALCPVRPTVELHDGEPDREHPPDKVLDGSNIYLTLRQLRI